MALTIGIMSSGALGNHTVRTLFDQGIIPAFIFTDKKSDGLIQFAGLKNIPLFIGNPRNGKGIKFLEDTRKQVQVILSINYLFLIEQDVASYPAYGAVNFHGSLLPKYRGRTPHVWAIINGEKTTGITGHYIDKGCDTGPILVQKTIAIGHETTGGEILNIFQAMYPGTILETLKLFENGRPQGIRQDESLASHFGVRTPEDGLIDWNWSKERIRNWVRAQAYPYPGAFTHYNNERVTIDKVSHDTTTDHSGVANGTVVIDGPVPAVKVSDGLVRIEKLRGEIKLERGKLLQ